MRSTYSNRASGSGDSERVSNSKRLNSRRSFWSRRAVQQSPLLPTRSSTARCVSDLTNLNGSNSTGRNQTSGDILKMALMARYGVGPARRVKSASNLRASQHTEERDAEDIVDEIMRLKKQMQSVHNENSLLKTKMRKMETDMAKKNKEIEELQDPAMLSVTSTKPGLQQRHLLQSLQQKVTRLEQTIKAKDAALNALKSDLKTKRMEEMRGNVETMYNEIQRLRRTKKTQVSPNNNNNGGSQLEDQNGVTSMQQTVLRLNELNANLKAENQGLKEKLNQMTPGQSISAKDDESYRSMNRSQLVQVIRNMEKELANQKHPSMDDKGRRKLERDDSRSESNKPAMAVSQQSDEIRRLEKKLEEKDQQISELIRELGNVRLQLQQQKADDDRDSPSHSSATRRNESNASNSNNKSDGSIKREDSENEHSDYNSTAINEFRRNKASKTIQRNWKQHGIEKQEALRMIVSVIGGHLIRLRALEKWKNRDADRSGSDWSYGYSDDASDSCEEDALAVIASGFPGHATMKHTPNTASGESDSANSEDTASRTSMSLAQGRVSRQTNSHQSENTSTHKTWTRSRANSVDEFYR